MAESRLCGGWLPRGTEAATIRKPPPVKHSQSPCTKLPLGFWGVWVSDATLVHPSAVMPWLVTLIWKGAGAGFWLAAAK